MLDTQDVPANVLISSGKNNNNNPTKQIKPMKNLVLWFRDKVELASFAFKSQPLQPLRPRC